ncbi:MAG: hypothetical protein ACI901_001026, partial [Octadecabacter sp.]
MLSKFFYIAAALSGKVPPLFSYCVRKRDNYM